MRCSSNGIYPRKSEMGGEEMGLRPTKFFVTKDENNCAKNIHKIFK